MPPPRPKDAVLDSDSDDEFVDASSEPPNFDPEEEASLLAESNAIKTSANALYATARFSEAIGAYDRARAALPTHLAYEIAVLKSNAAACHVRLAEWRQAVEAASAALDGLERVLPSAGAARRRKKKERGRRREAEAGAKGRDEAVESRKAGNGHEGTVEMGAEGSEADEERERERESGQVVELDADDDDVAERELQRLRLGDERRAQVESLRAKSLLRRARGNAEQGGWGSLVAAEEDYKDLAQMSVLPPADQRFVRQQLAALPARINEAREREMGEMVGKLKELGNGILKPFGLSTDMFKFQKDERTGGYNMSFGGGEG